MQRQSVTSRNLRSVGYDEAGQVLEVEFWNGGIYQYFGVPVTRYTGLMSASSHGRYHHAYIKTAYRYRKVG